MYEMVEQNISGVKLEQLRQNAVKKHKILRKLLPVCLILFIGLTLVKTDFCLSPSANMALETQQLRGPFGV